MKQHREPSICRSRKGERGQALVFMLVALIPFFLLMIALAADLGYVYCGYRQLQASTDAAAMAAGQDLPNIVTAAADAQLYGGVSGKGTNVYTNLQNVAMGTPVWGCSTTLSGEGLPCSLTSSPIMPNTAQVTQTATVPLKFLGYFSKMLGGSPSVNIATTSRASERQAAGGPYNVAIIIDTTKSMGDQDTDSQCSAYTSRLACVLAGVQILLQDLAPCSPSAGCTTPLDVVSLFVFPPVTVASAPDDYCSGHGPSSISTVSYATAESPSTYPLPSGPSPNTYQIIPFSSDYRTSNSATTLNNKSDLVLATGAYPSLCSGLYPKGGSGTYFAGVINAAQAALVAEQALPARAGSKNVIIILSDGEANASGGDFSGGNINGNGTGTLNNGSATYMSNLDQCQQAVQAAWTAATGGTTIYAVSYGSESSGCADTSNLSPVNMANITPCQTMQNISSTHAASTNKNFFSDYTTSSKGSDSTCISAANDYSNLNQIFTTIAGNFLVTQLVPNGIP
jgi:Flp pilus assembly protein TadG